MNWLEQMEEKALNCVYIYILCKRMFLGGISNCFKVEIINNYNNYSNKMKSHFKIASSDIALRTSVVF